METSDKEIKRHYKGLRRLGYDDIKAYNMTLDFIYKAYDVNTNSEGHNVSSVLRQGWRTSFDRKLGIKSGRTIRYEVQSLDVWGNARHGWEVNQSFRCGSIDVPEYASDRDIFKILRDQNYLSEGSKGAIKFDKGGDDMLLCIVDRKNGYPIWNLSKEVDE